MLSPYHAQPIARQKRTRDIAARRPPRPHQAPLTKSSAISRLVIAFAPSGVSPFIIIIIKDSQALVYGETPYSWVEILPHLGVGENPTPAVIGKVVQATLDRLDNSRMEPLV